MDFGTVTPQEMQAAQVLSAVCLAAFLLAGYLKTDTARLRIAIVVLYVVGAVGFVLYVTLR